MTPVIGQRAAHALFVETLRTTQQRFRWAVSDVVVEPSESTTLHLSAAVSSMSPQAAHEAAVAVLMGFSHLLASFVGDRLMLQSLREMWPGFFDSDGPTEVSGD